MAIAIYLLDMINEIAQTDFTGALIFYNGVLKLCLAALLGLVLQLRELNFGLMP
jgi:hypothetical protein